MVRNIVGFVAGYIAIGVVVMGGFVAGPLLLGIDRVIAPGTYQATPLWLWIALAIGLVGAIVGGAVCRAIARSRTPAYVLMALVLVVGLAMAVRGKAASEDVAPRPEGLSAMDVLRQAQEHGREPLFTKITNPLAGALGVLVGAHVVDRRKRAVAR